jgi:MFS family permease
MLLASSVAAAQPAIVRQQLQRPQLQLAPWHSCNKQHATDASVLLRCKITSMLLLLQGVIQSAFLWGYTATQLLGGSLADKYGGRAVIAAGEAYVMGPEPSWPQLLLQLLGRSYTAA